MTRHHNLITNCFVRSGIFITIFFTAFVVIGVVHGKAFAWNAIGRVYVDTNNNNQYDASDTFLNGITYKLATINGVTGSCDDTPYTTGTMPVYPNYNYAIGAAYVTFGNGTCHIVSFDIPSQYRVTNINGQAVADAPPPVYVGYDWSNLALQVVDIGVVARSAASATPTGSSPLDTPKGATPTPFPTNTPLATAAVTPTPKASLPPRTPFVTPIGTPITPTATPIAGTPLVDLQANGQFAGVKGGVLTVASGSDVLLTWNSVNTVDACSVSSDWGDYPVRARSGSEMKLNIISNKIYTITCPGLDPRTLDSDTIEVRVGGATGLYPDLVVGTIGVGGNPKTRFNLTSTVTNTGSVQATGPLSSQFCMFKQPVVATSAQLEDQCYNGRSTAQINLPKQVPGTILSGRSVNVVSDDVLVTAANAGDYLVYFCADTRSPGGNPFGTVQEANSPTIAGETNNCTFVDTVCIGPACTQSVLNLNGYYFAKKGFDLVRHTSDNTTRTPAEKFTERPDFLVTLSTTDSNPALDLVKQLFLIANYTWNEVAP